MPKYTSKPYECQKCSKRNYFIITIAEEKGNTYYITHCPRCKKYDEVRQLTATEAKAYEIQD